MRLSSEARCMGKIILTGAKGRIAAALRPMLHEHFSETIFISRTGEEGHLTWEQAFRTGLWSEAQSIIHCAWSTVPKISEENPGIEWQKDLPLLSKLLDAISRTDSAPHFVFLSSAGTVYGPAGNMPSREEDSPSPIGWYGRAKVAAEALVQEASSRSGVPTMVLRVSNPYGAGFCQQRPQGIIANAILAALTGKPLQIWGDGSALKDYLHTDDLQSAFQGILQARLTGTMNLCYGASHSLSEVFLLIEAALGRRITVVPGDSPSWDVKRSMIDGTRLQNAIGWKPRIGLEDGLQRSIQTLITQTT